MDAFIKEKLEQGGIDTESALERMMGSETIFFRLLNKFLEDDNYDKLTEAVRQGDMAAALTASHTLKGICGNLSIQKLFDLLTEQVTLFRQGNEEGAAALMEEISVCYEAAVDSIVESIGA